MRLRAVLGAVFELGQQPAVEKQRGIAGSSLGRRGDRGGERDVGARHRRGPEAAGAVVGGAGPAGLGLLTLQAAVGQVLVDIVPGPPILAEDLEPVEREPAPTVAIQRGQGRAADHQPVAVEVGPQLDIGVAQGGLVEDPVESGGEVAGLDPRGEVAATGVVEQVAVDVGQALLAAGLGCRQPFQAAGLEPGELARERVLVIPIAGQARRVGVGECRRQVGRAAVIESARHAILAIEIIARDQPAGVADPIAIGILEPDRGETVLVQGLDPLQIGVGIQRPAALARGRGVGIVEPEGGELAVEALDELLVDPAEAAGGGGTVGPAQQLARKEEVAAVQEFRRTAQVGLEPVVAVVAAAGHHAIRGHGHCPGILLVALAGDLVDYPAAGLAELGAEAPGDHADFLDRIGGDRQRGVVGLVRALIEAAHQHPIHIHRLAALARAADVELAIGVGHHSGLQRDDLLDRLGGDFPGGFAAETLGGLDIVPRHQRGLLGGHRDRLQLEHSGRQLGIQGGGITGRERHPAHAFPSVAGVAEAHCPPADRDIQDEVVAIRGGDIAQARALDSDLHPGERLAGGGVADRALELGAGLGGEGGGQQAAGEDRQEGSQPERVLP